MLTSYSAARAAPSQEGEAPAAQTHILAVFGDSQAEGLSVALRRVTRQISGVKVQNHTKAGTAISQWESYDWQSVMRDYVPDPGVDIAVMMFGGNDRLPMRPSPGVSIPFRSAAWETEYRSRTASILRSLAEKHLRVIWVSNPVCREPKYSQDMAYLNGIFRDSVAGTDGIYLDIWTAIADAEGHFAPYGKALNGSTTRMRLDDGIHFTPSGYDVIATRVIRTVMAPPAVTDTK
jgi:hypothetical protein